MALNSSLDAVFGDLDCNDNTPIMQPVLKQSTTSLLSPVHCLSSSPPPWVYDETSHFTTTDDLMPHNDDHSPSPTDNMSVEVQRSADDFFYDDEFAMQYDAAAGDNQSDESAGLWLTASLMCVGNSTDTWWSVPERLAASDGCLVSLRQSVGSLEASEIYSDNTSQLCDDEPLFTSPSVVDSQCSSLFTEGLTNSEGDTDEKYRLHAHQYTLAFDPGGKCSSIEESYQEPAVAACNSWVAGSTGSKLEHSVLVRANSDAPLTTWVQLTEQREPAPRMTSWQAMVAADQHGAGDCVRSKSLPTLEKPKACETPKRPASCGDDNPACSLFELFRRSRTEKDAVVSPGVLRRLTGTWSMSASSDDCASPQRHYQYPHQCECAVQTSLQGDLTPAVMDRSMQTSASLLAESATPSEILNMLPSQEDLQNSLRQCRNMLPPKVSSDSRSSLKSSLLSEWNMFAGATLPDLSFLNSDMTASTTEPPQTTTPNVTPPLKPARITENTNSCCSSSSSGIDAGSYNEHSCSGSPWCASREAVCRHCMVASHPCCNKRPTKPAESRRMDCLHVSPTHVPHDGRALCLWVQHKHPTVCISVGEISERPLKPCLVRRRRTGAQKASSALKHRSWSHPQDAAVMKYSNEGQTQYQLLTPRQCTSLPPEALQCASEPSQKVPSSIPLPVCQCHSACAVFNTSSESEDGALSGHTSVKTKKSVSFSEKVCYASPCSSPQCSPRHVMKSSNDSEHTRREGKRGRHKPVSDLQISDILTSSSEDEPPNSFLVSPPIGRRQMLQSDDLSQDWREKKDLLLQVTLAADILQDSMKNNTDSTREVSMQQPLTNSPSTVGQLVLQHVCPAVHAVILDGLRPHVRSLFGMVKNSVWSLVEDSAKLGPSTRIFHELVNDLKGLTFLDTTWLKFNAFIFGLLNYHALDFWLICIQSNDSLISKHYHSHACLSLSNKAPPIRQAYVAMTTSLRPLSSLPLRLSYDLEYESLRSRGAQHMSEYLVEKHVGGGSFPPPVSPPEGWVGRLYRLGGKMLQGQTTSNILPRSLSLLDDEEDELDAAGFGSNDKQFESLPVYKKGVTEYVFDGKRVAITSDKGHEYLRSSITEFSNGESKRRGAPAELPCAGVGKIKGCYNEKQTIVTNEEKTDSDIQITLTDQNNKCGERTEPINTPSPDSLAANQPTPTSTKEHHTANTPNVAADIPTKYVTSAYPSESADQRVKTSMTELLQSSASDQLSAIAHTASHYWKGSLRHKLNRFGLSLIDKVDSILLPSEVKASQVEVDGGDAKGDRLSVDAVKSEPEVSQAANRQVQALCYYVAGDSKHLSFERGDVMTVIGKPDADWLMCRHGNSQGFVHSACVEAITS